MGQPIMPIGPMRPYTYGRLGRPVASQFGPEAIGARFKARSGPAHSHLEWAATWIRMSIRMLDFLSFFFDYGQIRYRIYYVNP